MNSEGVVEAVVLLMKVAVAFLILDAVAGSISRFRKRRVRKRRVAKKEFMRELLERRRQRGYPDD